MILFARILFLFITSDVSTGALFGMSCEEYRNDLSEWSECIIPQGDLVHAITSFLRSVKDFGCKLPPRKIIKLGLNFLRNNSKSYLEHPLYKRISVQSCGKCGRRIRCCKRSKSFLAQAYESEACSAADASCIFDPLSSTDIQQLKEIYPKVAVPLNKCDVSSYVAEELQTLSQGPAYKYVEPLLCQILGTRIPAVNCVLFGDKCHCCCFSYTPQRDGRCHLNSTDIGSATHCPSQI